MEDGEEMRELLRIYYVADRERVGKRKAWQSLAFRKRSVIKPVNCLPRERAVNKFRLFPFSEVAQDSSVAVRTPEELKPRVTIRFNSNINSAPVT